jgi:hypothetical protein
MYAPGSKHAKRPPLKRTIHAVSCKNTAKNFFLSVFGIFGIIHLLCVKIAVFIIGFRVEVQVVKIL